MLSHCVLDSDDHFEVWGSDFFIENHIRKAAADLRLLGQCTGALQQPAFVSGIISFLFKLIAYSSIVGNSRACAIVSSPFPLVVVNLSVSLCLLKGNYSSKKR
jgi:hypothetical protein